MKKTRFEAAPDGQLLHGGERTKLIAMTVMVVLVIVVFFYQRMQDAKRSARELDQIAEADDTNFEERLVVPAFDASLLAGKVLDAREGDRVLLQQETLKALFDYTSSFNVAHFIELGMRDLDESARAELTADPEAQRANAFLARGWIDDLNQRIGSDGAKEYHGRLLLEDRSHCHFAVRSLPPGVIVDDFVRLDGLFLKLFRSEGEDGWLEGPLLVGPRLLNSWARPPDLDAHALSIRLAQITDDTINGGLTGLSGETFDAQWLMMDILLHGDQEETNWDEVPELDNETLVAIMTDGPAWRGAPLRMPIARSMDLWTSAPGENPARIDKVTMGWIGSWTWTNNKSAVIHYVMPRDAEHLRGARLVSARGYFIKNFAYETRDGNLRVAPYFVLTDIEEFIPPVDHTIRYIGIGLVVLTIGIIGLIFFGLRRDKRGAAAFHADLVRRRRARRERAKAAESN
jgi:hypothetical protein